MKITAIVFALLALSATVYAACPNQCSGHGRCGENDKCICYQQANTPWGQRRGYTGADCSRRTCPLGIAFDSISTQKNRIEDFTLAPKDDGVSVLNLFIDDMADYTTEKDIEYTVRITRVDSASDDAGNSGALVFKRDIDEYYSDPITFLARTTDTTDLTEMSVFEVYDASSGANKIVDGGIYFYIKGAATAYDIGDVYTFTLKHNDGVHFSKADNNLAHQYVECSGRGMCSDVTGRCQCFPGYTGEACQRTACPNDCSGHGVCQSESRFIDEYSSQTYTYSVAKFTTANDNSGVFDADKQMGCKCDQGFRGPDCSLIECPSGTDPLNLDDENGKNAGYDCSNRGICDYTSGQCKCFKGYFGERCETQTNYV